MLSDCQTAELEVIFMLIDRDCIPHLTISKFIEWLKNNDIERYAYLNWLLMRWPILRRDENHLPQRRLK
jgi:hypothetical protein